MRELPIRRWPFVFLVLITGGVAACSDNGTEPIAEYDEAQLLVEYIENQAGFDIHQGFIISAADVRTNLVTGANQYIIDMRASADFDAGHIDGAVNVATTELVGHLNDNDWSDYDVIVLACYSGQSAAYAAGILRARGFHNVKSMKWGMSSWHSDFAGPWTNNRSNQRVTQFVGGDSPDKPALGELPELYTGLTAGLSILDNRVKATLSAGFGPAMMTHATLFAALDNYFIVNYWPEALYENTGHIPGAINYDPSTKPFLLANDLKTLPTDEPIVIYCYTGQGSAFLAGYLRVLGYDARTLLFGANGMIFDKLVDDGIPSVFVPEDQVMDYDYVL